MDKQEIIMEVEDALDPRFRELEAKVETLIVRFNELLQRLQVMLNTKLDHLKIPEEDEK